MALRKEAGDEVGIATTLNNLGFISEHQMEFGRARRMHEESLRIRRASGDRAGEAMSLNNLGNVAYWLEEFDRAETLQLESLKINRELSDPWGLGWSLRDLARVMRKTGEFVAARSYLDESLRIRLEIGDQSGIAESLEVVGMLECSLRRPRNAARILAATEAIRETIQLPISPPAKRELDLVLEEVRGSLGDEVYRTEWRQGRSMTIEQALQLALRQQGKEGKIPSD